MSVRVNLGSVEPLGFDGAVSGVRQRSSELYKLKKCFCLYFT